MPTAEEIELSHVGTVTTFCIVNVPFLGQKIQPPYVSAYVLLDGADIAFLHLILGCDADEVRIEIGDERIRARRAVLATGAWITDLIPDLDLPLRIVRSPLVWFTGPDREAYRPGRFPVFVRQTGDLDGWGISDVDGAGVKIGAGPSAPKPVLQHAGDNGYPIDARDTDPPEQFCRRAFPGLNPVAAAARACMNSATPDRDFVLGASSLAPSLILAGGFSGHGFKHAAASGDVSVDLALDGASAVPLHRFSPDRFHDQEV